jgi:hypothetical protein
MTTYTIRRVPPPHHSGEPFAIYIDGVGLGNVTLRVAIHLLLLELQGALQ